MKDKALFSHSNGSQKLLLLRLGLDVRLQLVY